MEVSTAQRKIERCLNKIQEAERLIKQYEEEVRGENAQEVEDVELQDILNTMDSLMLRIAEKNKAWKRKFKMEQITHEEEIIKVNNKLAKAYSTLVELTKKSEKLELELKTKVNRCKS